MAARDFAFEQEQFESLVEKLEQRQKETAREANYRKFFAYGLKIIVILAGLVIAMQAPSTLDKVLGAAISLATALDQIFSNHVRLIAVTTATKALARAYDAIVNRHTNDIGPVVAAAKSGDESTRKAGEEKGANALFKMRNDFDAKLQEIETALDEQHIKALEKLTLE
ncbi:MAG: hypothetical protein AAF541_22775 [Pseudomonadota bacterium]